MARDTRGIIPQAGTGGAIRARLIKQNIPFTERSMSTFPRTSIKYPFKIPTDALAASVPNRGDALVFFPSSDNTEIAQTTAGVHQITYRRTQEIEINNKQKLGMFALLAAGVIAAYITYKKIKK